MKKMIIYLMLFFMTVLLTGGPGYCKDPTRPSGLSGEKISLDIKGMDILDVLKIISMKSGLNIVAGRNVSGRVTIFLKEVDMWDALEIILAANSLAYERKGNILNIMTERDYELLYGEKFYNKKKLKVVKLHYAKAADASKALSQIKTSLGKIVADEGSNTLVIEEIPSRMLTMEQVLKQIDVPVESRVFTLQYSSAEDILPKITEMLTKNLGEARIEERTNKIAVKDTPKRLKEIAEIIAEFDQRDAQVLIEAKILEIDLSDRFQMGVDWEYLFSRAHGLSLSQELSLDIAKNAKLRAGGAWSGIAPTATGDYSALIEVLKTIGDVNTLSAPKITAINNQESKILIGTREPYATKSVVSSEEATTTAEQVTFVDVGIKLYVTPTINADGFVTMKIRPEVSSAGTSYTTSEGNEIPIVSTTEAETTVMIKDSNSILIAGLIKDKQDKTVKRIPLLSSMPIIGGLFRSIDDTKTKKEVVIILTPHIITGEKTMTDAPANKRETDEKGILLHKKMLDALMLNDAVKEEEPKEKAIEIKKAPEAKKEEAKEKAVEIKVSPEAKSKALSDALKQIGYPGEYYNTVRAKILGIVRKNYKQASGKGDVLLSFVVAPNGRLKKEPRIIREDSKLVGDFALKCVKDAVPFAVFPEGISHSEQEISILISVK